MQIGPCAKTRVNELSFTQMSKSLAIDLRALRLIEYRAKPFKTKVIQVTEQPINMLFLGSLRIKVLYPEYKMIATQSSNQKREDISHMQTPRRAGGKPSNSSGRKVFHVHRERIETRLRAI